VEMFWTTSALLNVPMPLTRVQIPPGIPNYAAPIPLAAVQDSLLKNGVSSPGIHLLAPREFWTRQRNDEEEESRR
jgi:hypothetical protein